MRISLFLLMAAFLAPMAPAAPLQWSVVNGTFADGATVTGSFVFDHVTKLFSSWNLVVGSGPNFSAYTYSSADPASVAFYNGFGAPATEAVVFQDSNTARTLVFQMVGQLTTIGSTVAMDVSMNPSFSSLECFNCNPARFVATGSLFQGTVSSVPEPSTVLLVAGALVLGVRRRRSS